MQLNVSKKTNREETETDQETASETLTQCVLRIKVI